MSKECLKHLIPTCLFILITTGCIGYKLCDFEDTARGVSRLLKSGLVCYYLLD